MYEYSLGKIIDVEWRCEKMSETKKPKYDPVWARHAADDLAERLYQLDLCEYELTECDKEEYESLTKLAESIAYSLVPLEATEKDRRKVLFTNGMHPDKMLIITDAPKERIEEFCRHLNQEMENGENTYFDSLKKDYYVNVLFDSELSSESEDVDVIGYDEVYDFSDYLVSSFEQDKSNEKLSLSVLTNRIAAPYGITRVTVERFLAKQGFIVNLRTPTVYGLSNGVSICSDGNGGEWLVYDTNIQNLVRDNIPNLPKTGKKKGCNP